PKCPASQPVSGIMIAAATMYEVSTQAAWSWATDRLPWMCGSATLAIVLSTPCIIVASMIDAVIAARLGTGARVSPTAAVSADAVIALSGPRPGRVLADGDHPCGP